MMTKEKKKAGVGVLRSSSSTRTWWFAAICVSVVLLPAKVYGGYWQRGADSVESCSNREPMTGMYNSLVRSLE